MLRKMTVILHPICPDVLVSNGLDEVSNGLDEMTDGGMTSSGVRSLENNLPSNFHLLHV